VLGVLIRFWLARYLQGSLYLGHAKAVVQDSADNEPK
jgi:hypothetical protein